MGNITLKMLLDEGLVLPGENNLVSEYKGVTQLASLRSDGRISCMVSQLHDAQDTSVNDQTVMFVSAAVCLHYSDFDPGRGSASFVVLPCVV